jgi:hypothetical protein
MLAFCLDEVKCGWFGKEGLMVLKPTNSKRDDYQGPLVCPVCFGDVIFEEQVKQAMEDRKKRILVRRWKKKYDQSEDQDFYRYEPI